MGRVKMSEIKKEIKDFFLGKTISVTITDVRNDKIRFENGYLVDDVLFPRRKSIKDSKEIRFISRTKPGVILSPVETSMLLQFSYLKIVTVEPREIYEYKVI